MTQYAHIRKSDILSSDVTIAIFPPKKEELEQMFLSHSNQTMLLVGISVTSKKDEFTKKEGRRLSSGRLTPTVADLKLVVQREVKHEYKFITVLKFNRKTYQLWLTLCTVAETNVVRVKNVAVAEI